MNRNPWYYWTADNQKTEWPEGAPLPAGADLQKKAFLEQFTKAVWERRWAIYNASVNAIGTDMLDYPPVDNFVSLMRDTVKPKDDEYWEVAAGTDVQHYRFYRDLQEAILGDEEGMDTWARKPNRAMWIYCLKQEYILDNSEFTGPDAIWWIWCDVLYDPALCWDNRSDFLEWCGLNRQGLTRKTPEGTYQGFIEAGDYIGPWIFEEMRKCIAQLNRVAFPHWFMGKCFTEWCYKGVNNNDQSSPWCENQSYQVLSCSEKVALLQARLISVSCGHVDEFMSNWYGFVMSNFLHSSVGIWMEIIDYGELSCGTPPNEWTFNALWIAASKSSTKIEWKRVYPDEMTPLTKNHIVYAMTNDRFSDFWVGGDVHKLTDAAELPWNGEKFKNRIASQHDTDEFSVTHGENLYHCNACGYTILSKGGVTMSGRGCEYYLTVITDWEFTNG